MGVYSIAKVLGHLIENFVAVPVRKLSVVNKGPFLERVKRNLFICTGRSSSVMPYGQRRGLALKKHDTQEVSRTRDLESLTASDSDWSN